jgi:hypothetical protein
MFKINKKVTTRKMSTKHSGLDTHFPRNQREKYVFNLGFATLRGHFVEKLSSFMENPYDFLILLPISHKNTKFHLNPRC